MVDREHRHGRGLSALAAEHRARAGRGRLVLGAGGLVDARACDRSRSLRAGRPAPAAALARPRNSVPCRRRSGLLAKKPRGTDSCRRGRSPCAPPHLSGIAVSADPDSTRPDLAAAGIGRARGRRHPPDAAVLDRRHAYRRACGPATGRQRPDRDTKKTSRGGKWLRRSGANGSRAMPLSSSRPSARWRSNITGARIATS
jgi:hypothetical protein